MNIGRPAGRTREARPVRVMVVGDRRDVEAVIAHICVLGFCDRAEWSDVMPHPNSADFMSVMTKWRGDREG